MYRTGFRMKGLSTKKVHDLCKDESGYYIDNWLRIEGRTAKIKVPELIKFLIELYEVIPFDKITIKGRYEVTADYLMEAIQKATA